MLDSGRGKKKRGHTTKILDNYCFIWNSKRSNHSAWAWENNMQDCPIIKLAILVHLKIISYMRLMPDHYILWFSKCKEKPAYYWEI